MIPDCAKGLSLVRGMCEFLIEAEIYKIGAKHGIRSIFELDEKLKRGTITEEEMRDDFMELDYLESKRDDLLKAMGRIPWQI